MPRPRPELAQSAIKALLELARLRCFPHAAGRGEKPVMPPKPPALRVYAPPAEDAADDDQGDAGGRP